MSIEAQTDPKPTKKEISGSKLDAPCLGNAQKSVLSNGHGNGNNSLNIHISS